MKINKTAFIAFLFAAVVLSCNDTKKAKDPEKIVKEAIQENKEKTEEMQGENLIKVKTPQPNAEIASPIKIRGKARGTWFFEGDFPVRLLDENNREISVAIATAQGEWMTEEWVDFTATMEFEAPDSGTGILVFEKSNPSDKRELDNEFRVPVKFN